MTLLPKVVANWVGISCILIVLNHQSCTAPLDLDNQLRPKSDGSDACATCRLPCTGHAEQDQADEKSGRGSPMRPLDNSRILPCGSSAQLGRATPTIRLYSHHQEPTSRAGGPSSPFIPPSAPTSHYSGEPMLNLITHQRQLQRPHPSRPHFDLVRLLARTADWHVDFDAIPPAFPLYRQSFSFWFPCA